MKVKQDFVTNSSSTSFCGFGAAFDMSELKEMVAALKDLDEDTENLYDVLEKEVGKFGLTTVNYYDNIYIALEFSNADMDMTKRDMKTKVEQAFINLGINKDVELVEESWYDG